MWPLPLPIRQTNADPIVTLKICDGWLLRCRRRNSILALGGRGSSTRADKTTGRRSCQAWLIRVLANVFEAACAIALSEFGQFTRLVPSVVFWWPDRQHGRPGVGQHDDRDRHRVCAVDWRKRGAACRLRDGVRSQVGVGRRLDLPAGIIGSAITLKLISSKQLPGSQAEPRSATPAD